MTTTTNLAVVCPAWCAVHDTETGDESVVHFGAPTAVPLRGGDEITVQVDGILHRNGQPMSDGRCWPPTLDLTWSGYDVGTLSAAGARRFAKHLLKLADVAEQTPGALA